MQRFNKLGIAHSNFVLWLAGQHISRELSGYMDARPNKIIQDEGNTVYKVNNYPEKYTKRIDEEILLWINHTPAGKAEKQRILDCWKYYKRLPR